MALNLEWSVGSWKNKKALQLPEYPDETELNAVLDTLESFPPLVLASEIRSLEERLANAAKGNAFLLQGGDCAESFKEFSADKIFDTFTTIAQMSDVLMLGGQIPVIKVGRIAGQFAKPRSTTHEEQDGLRLPIYKGDSINGYDFNTKSRIPDPQRMIKAYSQSGVGLNFIRALVTGGRLASEKVLRWNGILDFLQTDRCQEVLAGCKIDEARGFMGEETRRNDACYPLPVHGFADEFWTSHECLLLPYEQSLTREDKVTGLWYDHSAHMLWIGERTRQIDGAHVEFPRGVANPIGIKVSDKISPQELVDLIAVLNPNNKAGRVTVITRMGAENLRTKLPHLIRAVGEAGQIVTWVSDPMHANPIKAPCGRRTRPFDAIMAEVEAFFEVHETEGSHPGGIHLEMTGQNVTECIGGSVKPLTFADLGKRYLTHCDPRLNASQSLELAFLIALLLKKHRIGKSSKNLPSNGSTFVSHNSQVIQPTEFVAVGH